MEIDDFDRQILAILKVDARQTGDQLSERVGVSPAACLRRVQRLRKIGAIEREVAILSPEVDGNAVTILAFLQIARGPGDRTRAVREVLSRMPEVQKIYHVTGQSDLVLVLQCTSMEHYATFSEAHFYSDFVTGYESMVVLRDFSPKLG